MKSNVENGTIKIFGFVDRNRDGINDLFRDSNGDGINDVTGKPYPHAFEFKDENEDKINDIYTDKDGDGVNDLDVRFVDKDSNGINDNIVDSNRDYINDITGLRYNKKSLRGYKFGFIKEERQVLMSGFVDENADGIPDHPGRLRLQHGRAVPPVRGDRFIDRDGDGIDDRRMHFEQLKNKMRGGKR